MAAYSLIDYIYKEMISVYLDVGYAWGYALGRIPWGFTRYVSLPEKLKNCLVN